MRRTWMAVGAALAAGGVLWLAAPAGAALYWTTTTREGAVIGRAHVDGSSVDRAFVRIGGATIGLVVDCRYVYWADRALGAIGRASLDGTDVRPDFITDLRHLRGLAVDDHHIYWGERSRIGRADLDGGRIDHAFIDTGTPLVWGLALDDDYLYWPHDDGVGRAPLNGATPQRSFVDVPLGGRESWVAVNAEYVYWSSEFGRVGRARLDGTAVVRDLGLPALAWGLAVDDQHLYWSDPGRGTIERADLDGSDARPSHISVGSHVWDVAVDRFDCAGARQHRPFVASVTPASASTRGGDTITIRGENFSDGTGVLFDGTPASSVQVINHTTLRVQTPAHTPGGYPLTVVNQNGRSPRDSAGFTFIVP